MKKNHYFNGISFTLGPTDKNDWVYNTFIHLFYRIIILNLITAIVSFAVHAEPEYSLWDKPNQLS